ncbi:TolB amino-terminal domain-containing protein [Ruegeria halocynthiae]|uniref:TolB amino-terminal domain-containing protein n=1 Tax=Ruegeria halocynthiae TaxID=985054 RepID=A0A1H2YXV9_9RHOB|nr:adenylate/guanylate cyclase domain-containing protein [Ruegeria halocynthiae]SDX09907.1 TolB amino-terminal domain-containing protein [Ruegeria halocynthiae]
MERRLTAILAADVVGYSRLIRNDETGVLAALKSHRERFFEPIVAAHNGRIVKLMGDGLLIDFSSAVEAVRCAVNLQHYVSADNADIPQDAQVRYRIGLNVGDIVMDQDDIHGDGVNVAARIESLAEPDGIYMSASVVEQVKTKLDLNLEDMGMFEVKNISDPIHVFSIPMDDKAMAIVSAIARHEDMPTKNRLFIAAGIAAAMALGLAAWWQLWSIAPSHDADEQAGLVSGKPSIAVMAFDNLNNDPNQDYLSDGLSESILTALSRFADFFVVARNSSFSYKDSPADARQIAQELGVRYIVEGGVQIVGERLRVTSQLIDATTGQNIWADSYDRELQDIFAVQDEITRTVASLLSTNIDLAEYGRLKHQPTESLGAYELRKRAQEEWFNFTKEGNIRAEELSAKAIALDPNYAGAYVENAWAQINGYRWGWTNSLTREESLERAFIMARKAIELEPFNFKGHWVLANATTQSGNLERAAALYDKAISLNPNSASVLADSIDPLVYGGNAPEAVERMKLAVRLNPHHQDWYLWNLGWAQYFAEEYEAAKVSIEKMTKIPDGLKRTYAPVLLRNGLRSDAQAVMNDFLKANPDFSIQEAQKAPFENKEYLSRWVGDLRALGVPDSKN